MEFTNNIIKTYCDGTLLANVIDNTIPYGKPLITAYSYEKVFSLEADWFKVSNVSTGRVVIPPKTNGILYWEAIPNASYGVYCKTNFNDQWTLITKTVNNYYDIGYMAKPFYVYTVHYLTNRYTYVTNGVPTTRVTLAFDPSPSTNISYYKLYYGTNSGAYLNAQNVGTNLQYTLTNTSFAGRTWFFAATATDTLGLDSDYSNEASFNGTTGSIVTNTTVVTAPVKTLKIAKY
jgi:hypothetical protein